MVISGFLERIYSNIVCAFNVDYSFYLQRAADSQQRHALTFILQHRGGAGAVLNIDYHRRRVGLNVVAEVWQPD